jgi:hypothetical protein
MTERRCGTCKYGEPIEGFRETVFCRWKPTEPMPMVWASSPLNRYVHLLTDATDCPTWKEKK